MRNFMKMNGSHPKVQTQNAKGLASVFQNGPMVIEFRAHNAIISAECCRVESWNCVRSLGIRFYMVLSILGTSRLGVS